MTILADPQDPTHVRLFRLSETNDAEDKDLTFAVGWSGWHSRADREQRGR